MATNGYSCYSNVSVATVTMVIVAMIQYAIAMTLLVTS